MAGAFLAFALLIIGLFYIMIPWHDLTLWRMERALASSSVHPLNSHVLAQRTFLGSRYTDTEECTYVVGQFRSTSLSPNDVLQAYKGASANLFNLTDNPLIYTIIIKEDTSLPLDNPADEWIVEFQEGGGPSTPSLTYYLVYLYEKGKPWWGDIRCYE